MKCPNCGTTVAAGDRHCRGCGTGLTARPVPEADETVAPQTDPAPVLQVPPAATGGRNLEDMALGVIGLVVAGVMWLLVMAGAPGGLTYVGLLIAFASVAKLKSDG